MTWEQLRQLSSLQFTCLVGARRSSASPSLQNSWSGVSAGPATRSSHRPYLQNCSVLLEFLPLQPRVSTVSVPIRQLFLYMASPGNPRTSSNTPYLTSTVQHSRQCSRLYLSFSHSLARARAVPSLSSRARGREIRPALPRAPQPSG